MTGQLPVLIELHERYRERGLEIVSVSIDEKADTARRAAKQHDASWRQVCDGRKWEGPLCTPFKVGGIPDCLVFGRDGRLRGRGDRGLELIELVEMLLLEPEQGTK